MTMKKVPYSPPLEMANPYRGCDGAVVPAMILDEEGINVAEAVDREHGEFIVLACNAYDLLKEACRAAVAVIGLIPVKTTEQQRVIQEVYDNLNEALAATESKGG